MVWLESPGDCAPVFQSWEYELFWRMTARLEDDGRIMAGLRRWLLATIWADRLRVWRDTLEEWEIRRAVVRAAAMHKHDP